jgi:hypothetical protein
MAERKEKINKKKTEILKQLHNIKKHVLMICFEYVMICIEEKRKLETINKICQKTTKTNKLHSYFL